MPRAKKQVSDVVELSAADRREFAEFLSASHDELGLRRKCTRARCQRDRRCCGEVDECGAARAPKEWARVRSTVAGMRNGQSRSAARQAANAAHKPRLLVIDYGKLGKYVFEVDDEGKWTRISGPPDPGSGETTHADWERVAPQGKG